MYWLLYKETRAHDGAVHGDEGQEDAERGIERGGEAFHNHFNQLHHTGNDGDEENEREERQIYAFDDAVWTEHFGLQQIVHGHGDEQHEGYGNAEAEGCLHVLAHCQVGAHAEEEGEYHIVHENGADEKT